MDWGSPNLPNGSAPDSLPTGNKLARLVHELLTEPFAVENFLGELTIESIESLFNETRDQWEKVGPDPFSLLGTPDLEQSFNRCLELFVSILLELENESKTDFAQETLLGLTDRRTATKLVLVKRNEEKVEPTKSVLKTEIQKPMEMQSPVEDLSGEDEIEGPPELTLITSMLRKQINDASLRNSRQADKIVEPPAKSYDIPQMSDYLHEMQVDTPLPKKLPDDSPAETLRPRLSGDAQDYYTLSEFLFSLAHHPAYSLPPAHLDKMGCHALFSALETETAKKIGMTFRGFWAIRELAIDALLAPGGTMELHPQLKAGLNHLVANTAGLAHEDRVPMSAIMNSLKYLMASGDVNRFHPTLIDYGTLIVFFGHSRQMGGISLTNQLGIENLSSDECLKLGFTYFRLYKWKQKVLALGTDFTPENRHQVEEHIDTAMSLLHRIKIG